MLYLPHVGKQFNSNNHYQAVQSFAQFYKEKKLWFVRMSAMGKTFWLLAAILFFVGGVLILLFIFYLSGAIVVAVADISALLDEENCRTCVPGSAFEESII